MCTTNIYTYIRSDGREEVRSRPALCPNSRHGQLCPATVVLQYPSPQGASYTRPEAPAFAGPASYPHPYMNHFPPTPTYSSRSATPCRSGDESDRSQHSSTSSRRRRSDYNAPARRLEHNHFGRDRRERILVVDNPPTPRTPPQAFTFPHTAPSSPRFAHTSPVIVDASPRSHSSRRLQPVIVDERSSNERDSSGIHIYLAGRKDKHARQSSTSSHDSRHSYTSASERLELEQLRAEKRQLEKKEEVRQQKLRERIARANVEICNRPAVPVAPAPLKRSSTATTVNAAQAVKEREDDLLESIRKLDVKGTGRGRRARKEEEEAQRYRLSQRLLPHRRATVGPGSRRHRVQYDDGVYRWE